MHLPDVRIGLQHIKGISTRRAVEAHSRFLPLRGTATRARGWVMNWPTTDHTGIRRMSHLVLRSPERLSVWAPPETVGLLAHAPSLARHSLQMSFPPGSVRQPPRCRAARI